MIVIVQGRSEGYIAMGLSRDDRMGDDLTTNCVVRSNGGVDVVTGKFQTYIHAHFLQFPQPLM